MSVRRGWRRGHDCRARVLVAQSWRIAAKMRWRHAQATLMERGEGTISRRMGKAPIFRDPRRRPPSPRTDARSPLAMTSFSDHFSGIAASYATYRPGYPAALCAWLAGLAPDRARAWDCGTGSGQAAEGLAAHFDEVVATDPSVAQLTNAPRVDHVAYVAMTAERVALVDHAVALVTVAQALHWFERTDFYREVDRVLRPGGVLAAWTYALAIIDPDVDAILSRFHTETMGPYWPPQRSLPAAGYLDLYLPYPDLSPPPFDLKVDADLPQLLGYT